jgi:hypothetical protein
MKKHTPLIILFVMLTTIACTKFKEDSFISLRTPYGRIFGTWHLDYYEIDGVDSTSLFYSKNYWQISNCDIKFSDDKSNHQFISQYVCNGNIGSGEIFGIDYRKKQIEWLCSYIPNRNPNGKSFYNDFNILKLYKNDLWLSLDIYGKHYFIKMKKISK